MNKNCFFLFVSLALLIACNSGTQQTNENDTKTELAFKVGSHQEFLNNLASLCDNSFRGEQVYRSHHGDSWAHRKMIMHVTVCEEDKVHIPFHIDDDFSRTWMFFAEDGKLCFRHQHLYEDGTHEDDSMYGGYATDEGTSLIQYFPADDFTAQVIEDGGGNLWTVSMDEKLTWFSYRLDRDGEKRFEIRFDLTKPIEK